MKKCLDIFVKLPMRCMYDAPPTRPTTKKRHIDDATTMANANDGAPKEEQNATRKRKSDVLSRVAEGTTSSKGRGSESGWTCCPLCQGYSKKKFALGRGITAHLHAMHTPWNPGSIERKKRERMLKRQESEMKRNKESQQVATKGAPTLTCWEPTRQEQKAWDQQVIQIASELEKKAKSDNTGNEEWAKPGLDRNGKQSKKYRESLPPFIQAAANGDQDRLKEMVQECKNATTSDNEQDSLQKLLNTRDRNGSTAEHWAAGGGHLSCLQFLLELGGSSSFTDDDTGNNNPKRVRRRDGKTCLHYAARNGRLDCIRYLIKQGFRVDDASGDGTTALHMACYGGHVKVVACLINNGANVHKINEWECGCAHWVGMTHCESSNDVRDLCRLLQAKGVSFVISQKQGHSALHKAAQRKNKDVIEWMMESADEGGAGLSPTEMAQAGKPDVGGHRASEIWRSVGGDESFAKKIETTFESS